jgi:beta-lactamase class A
VGSVRSGLETAIDIAETFAGAGARGFVHAREIGGSGEVGVDADEPVVLASVFKIAVALGYARTVAAGRLDPTARTRVTGWDRTGGIGTAGCADDVEMSWRDLARFMLTMSDNAATDVVLREIGLDSVRRVLAELGLHRTTLMGGCAEILATMVAESGCHDLAGLEDGTATLEPAVLWSLSALDASRTTSGTARETTALLDAIWRDRAGPPTACGQVRAMMADQIWPHRLSAGFPDAVRIAGKTGTLPSIRNEVGVVEYPDGGRYAVAVFTRAHRLDVRAPAIDAAIGIAARLAVDRLRNRP